MKRAQKENEREERKHFFLKKVGELEIERDERDNGTDIYNSTAYINKKSGLARDGSGTGGTEWEVQMRHVDSDAFGPCWAVARCSPNGEMASG